MGFFWCVRDVFVLIFCTLVFIEYLPLVSRVHNVASVSALSIHNCPIGFLKRLFNKVDLHPCQGEYDKVSIDSLYHLFRQKDCIVFLVD